MNQFLVDEDINNKTIINSDQNIEVSRTININGKQLDIAYLGTAGEQTISKSISITPQAVRWCS